MIVRWVQALRALKKNGRIHVRTVVLGKTYVDGTIRTDDVSARGGGVVSTWSEPGLAVIDNLLVNGVYIGTQVSIGEQTWIKALY